MERGKLPKDDVFRYVVVALASYESAEASERANGLRVEERVVTLHLLDSSLIDWLRRATAVGIDLQTTCLCLFRNTSLTKWPSGPWPNAAAKPEEF